MDTTYPFFNFIWADIKWNTNDEMRFYQKAGFENLEVFNLWLDENH